VPLINPALFGRSSCLERRQRSSLRRLLARRLK
jgi:hypothetical protein